MKSFMRSRFARLLAIAVPTAITLPAFLAAGPATDAPLSASGQNSGPKGIATRGMASGRDNAIAHSGAAPAARTRRERQVSGTIAPHLTPRPASLAHLEGVQAGAMTNLPLFSQGDLKAKLNMVRSRGPVTQLAGSLSGAEHGSFSLSEMSGRVAGTLCFPDQKQAFRVEGSSLASAVLRPVPLHVIVCSDLPRMINEPVRRTTTGARAAAAVPILNSRPSAVAQLYLDFDGEVVTDPNWNFGETIVAPPWDLTSNEIQTTWQRVKEDYWPFNINITTDVNKYNSAPVGKRMRVIITSNDAAAPGAGGVAYLNSFAEAGTNGFTSDEPCWVFNSSPIGISEACSHEAGHTFGLTHDGREIPNVGHEEYYLGQNSADGAVATGWAPIMGASYYKAVSQWSRGEYLNANNFEDDVATIANAANGFGFVPDEAGGTPGTAAVLKITGNQVNQTGVISNAADADYYSFYSDGGPVTFSAIDPSIDPNLDIALEIHDAQDKLLGSARPVDVLNASLTTTLAVGQYYLVVKGDGVPSMPATGYSTYGSIGGYSITGTAHAAPPQFSIQDVSLQEGNSGSTSAVFKVALSYGVATPVTVKFATTDGTATAPSDYTATSGTLTFPAGTTTQQIAVPVIGDLSVESDETFQVTLSVPTGATIAAATATGTIINDDIPLTLAVSDAQVVEGNSGTSNLSFPVTLSRVAGAPVTVKFATKNGTAVAPADYSGASGTLTFAPGETAKTINVAVVGETVVEKDETLTVTLSSPTGTATIATATATGTILDDDSPLTFSIAGNLVTEGDSGTKTLTFPVTMSRTFAQAVSVNFATVNGTALAPSDFVATSGTLVFAKGETAKTVSVVVKGDSLIETNETFTVVLSAPTVGTIAAGTATGTIVNDDADPTITVGDAQIAEGDSGSQSLSFPVTLSKASPFAVSLQFATVDGTAVAPTDYLAATGTLTIPAGQTTGAILIKINGDTTIEPSETFQLVLTKPVRGTLLSGTATGMIVNDDFALSLSIAGASIVEGNFGTSTLSLPVTLNKTSATTVTVHYATSNGTAVAPSDYLATSGTLTFAPGETAKAVNVTVNGDTNFENDETFNVTLSQASVLILNGTAQGTILDDEPHGQPSGRLLYTSNIDGNQEIYLDSPYGADPVRLTFNSAADYDPTMSHNGSMVAFISNRGGTAQIWAVPTAGGVPVQVTSLTGRLPQNPVWSPDGKTIYFNDLTFETNGTITTNLRSVPASGGAAIWLTSDGLSSSPAISPDGKTIAFQYGSNHQVGQLRLRTVLKAASTILVAAPICKHPSWNPDGKQVVFAQEAGDFAFSSAFDIALVDVTTKLVTPITGYAADEDYPIFSPDGAFIADQRDDGFSTQIYIMNADGSASEPVTRFGDSSYPAWGIDNSGAQPLGAQSFSAQPGPSFESPSSHSQ